MTKPKVFTDLHIVPSLFLTFCWCWVGGGFWQKPFNLSVICNFPQATFPYGSSLCSSCHAGGHAVTLKQLICLLPDTHRTSPSRRACLLVLGLSQNTAYRAQHCPMESQMPHLPSPGPQTAVRAVPRPRLWGKDHTPTQSEGNAEPETLCGQEVTKVNSGTSGRGYLCYSCWLIMTPSYGICCLSERCIYYFNWKSLSFKRSSECVSKE